MDDPRAVALIYRIEHSDSIDYSHAKPLDVEDSRCRLRVDDRRARFEFKVHHGTEERARGEIADYIRVWEFDANRAHSAAPCMPWNEGSRRSPGLPLLQSFAALP